VEKAA